MLLGVFPRQPHLSGRQQWRALAVRVPSELHICSLMDKELWLKQFEDDQPTDRLRAIPMLAPKAPCPGNLFLGQGEPGLHKEAAFGEGSTQLHGCSRTGACCVQWFPMGHSLAQWLACLVPA